MERLTSKGNNAKSRKKDPWLGPEGLVETFRCLVATVGQVSTPFSILTVSRERVFHIFFSLKQLLSELSNSQKQYRFATVLLSNGQGAFVRRKKQHTSPRLGIVSRYNVCIWLVKYNYLKPRRHVFVKTSLRRR